MRNWLSIILAGWALLATIGWIWEYRNYKNMLTIAELEYDRLAAEEKFFGEFISMRGVILQDDAVGEKVEEAPKHHIDH